MQIDFKNKNIVSQRLIHLWRKIPRNSLNKTKRFPILFAIITLTFCQIDNAKAWMAYFGNNKGQTSDGHKIKIKVKGVKDTVCYLAGYYGPKQYYKDTARADANGLIIFEGKEELPGGIYSVILPGNTYFEFIVNEQNFSLETDTSNYIQNMKVKGSVENKLFFDHFQVVAKLQEEASELKKELKKVKENKDSTDMINEKLRKINKEVINYKRDIIRENPQTQIGRAHV